MIKALSIVGLSGSGKTELICRLLENLVHRGLQVAVLKHTHHCDPGDRDKDTWRFRQAGAQVAALAAPGLLQVYRGFPAEPPLAEILAALSPETDLVLVEGYKLGPLPKLAVVGREASGHLPDYPNLLALVSDLPLVTDLPVFRPDQVKEIARFILTFLEISAE